MNLPLIRETYAAAKSPAGETPRRANRWSGARERRREVSLLELARSPLRSIGGLLRRSGLLISPEKIEIGSGPAARRWQRTASAALKGQFTLKDVFIVI